MAETIPVLRRVHHEAAQHDLPGGFDEFLDRYYAEVPPGRLEEHRAEELLGVALSHWRLLERDDRSGVEIFNPTTESVGWRSPSTIVLTVADDAPFIVDTLAMAADELGLGTRLRINLVVDHGGAPTSLVAMAVDRVADAALDEVRLRFEHALDDITVVVGDWRPMADVTRSVAERADHADARFLEWMADGHFVFLAVDQPDAEPLGLLRRERHGGLIDLPRGAGDGDPWVQVTKSLAPSRVHRPARVDLVVAGSGDERWVFAGLFTADTYVSSVIDVPLLAEKVEQVHRLTGWETGTHLGNALRAELERHPRDELFEIDLDTLTRRSVELVHLDQRPRDVGLFVSADRFDRSWSALVLVPADRYDTDARRHIADLLGDALGGSLIGSSSIVGESTHSRVHLTYRGRLGPLDADRIADVRQQIAEVVRSWDDALRDELVAAYGDLDGTTIHARFASAFPSHYASSTNPAVALSDIGEILALDDRDGLSLRLARSIETLDDQVQLSVTHRGDPITLSRLLPILHDLGVEVVDEQPFSGGPGGEPPFRLLRLTLHTTHAVKLVTTEAGARFSELFRRVWFGDVEGDSLNRLCLVADLEWRQVVVVRAYARYLRQIGVWFDSSFLADTLVEHVELTRSLVDLFELRLDPDVEPDPAAEAARLEDIERALVAVTSLDQDRALRTLLDVVLATTRTNHFQEGPTTHLSLKFDPTLIDDLPEPRPQHEIFVYAPRVEGVHLRSGAIARGGLRHSDRVEDYRTEVLQLMKAQVTKNSVIVPTGAKGGFVCRHVDRLERDAARAEIEACYRTFISGLLDVTDDLVRGEIVPPGRTRRRDDDDAYLVVAADKGTATFSDVANEIACERGFWLGDAFASGGSTGYDHKAMGITARGAWESVRDHLAHRGIDVDVDPFSVVGIGDMSGDVFGNGMQCSAHIRLVAAFDHRHLFIDPDPDPAISLAERTRLFALGRSSWADYDPVRLSTGGGVYERSAKSVELSPEAWEALGLDGNPAPRRPDELVRAVLRSPVDLLWNGGIGTYVKASTETHRDAGDKTNDGVRVDATDLRCAVVGEGGNLGFTQAARIEYARAGGRIFTDAVDNAAGVNCSDHEVNIKILLDRVVEAGRLTDVQRNELLAAMTDDVAEQVLATNRAQAIALDNAVAEAPGMINVHRDQIRHLTDEYAFDPHLEGLRGDDELTELTDEGLTLPELAVVMAATKNALADELTDDDLSGEPYFADRLATYFPSALRDRHPDEIREHPLADRLVATLAANDVVHRAGVSMVFRLSDETAAPIADVVRAHAAAWAVFHGLPQWNRVGWLEVEPRIRTELRLAHRRLVERSTRWILRQLGSPLDVQAIVDEVGPTVSALAVDWHDLVAEQTELAIDGACAHWMSHGVPEDVALAAAVAATQHVALDVAIVARRLDADPFSVARTHFLLEELLGVETLRDGINRLPRRDRWQTLARSALRDELQQSQAELTTSVISEAPDAAQPGEQVARWARRYPRPIARWRSIAAELAQGGPPGLDQLSVTVREYANLAGRRTG